MTKTLLFATALAASLTLLTIPDVASASTSTTRLHGHTLMRSKVSRSAKNGGHSRKVFYGVGNGGQTPRTTATGGNAGGYSGRN